MIPFKDPRPIRAAAPRRQSAARAASPRCPAPRPPEPRSDRTAAAIATRASALAAIVPVTLLCGSALVGCASSHDSPEFDVPHDRYAEAFTAVREVLREYRFQVDRVDAAAGVITSKPKSTAGLATPWDRDQTTLGQEMEDFANDQQRRVRVTFEPRTPAPPQPPQPGLAAGPPVDLRQAGGPLTGRVMVVIDRVQRPGWRLSPKAIGTSSVAIDTALAERGMAPVYTVPLSQDPRLAARMGERIRRRLGTPRPADPPPSGP